MSGGEGRKLSNHDIQLVQNRVERCLQHYMNKKEVINTLISQDNIEPRFTELDVKNKIVGTELADDMIFLVRVREVPLLCGRVWQRLEEENQEFFKAYYLKLLVKDQIMEFNRLLSEQVELMHRIELSGVAPLLTSNGTHVSPTQEIATSCTAQYTRPLPAEDMQHNNVYNNCGSPIQSFVQGTVDGFVHRRKFDVSQNLLLSQNSNMGLAQTMNGKIVKTEAGYEGSPFNFIPPSNFLESRPLMGDVSVSSFSSIESNAQHLNDPLLDGDASSFGLLAQISQTFSLPEFAADFNNNSDLLESFCRPPFLETEANNFGETHGDVERLDPACESLRYQCFGSD